MELDFTILIDSLNRHSKAIESLIEYSKATTGALAASQAASTGEAQAKRGPGRPPKTDAVTVVSSAQTAQTSTQTVVAPVSASPAVKGGPLTHRDLVVSFKEFAKVHGRDGVVKLLGEFGAAEFGQVKADDLPLFKGRLEGVAQTPTDPSDVSNLLGLT